MPPKVRRFFKLRFLFENIFAAIFLNRFKSWIVVPHKKYGSTPIWLKIELGNFFPYIFNSNSSFRVSYIWFHIYVRLALGIYFPKSFGSYVLDFFGVLPRNILGTYFPLKSVNLDKICRYDQSFVSVSISCILPCSVLFSIKNLKI